MRNLVIALGSLSFSFLFAACGGSPNVHSTASADTSSDNSSSGSCKSSDDCPSGDYCALKSGASCTEKGSCQPLPFACPQICQPVCGCDGNTYDNYCDAEQALTNPAFDGFCEKNPATGCWGGYAGQSCTPATAQTVCNPNAVGEGYKGSSNSPLYCDATSDTCVAIPAGCDDSGKVCGTDGNTYASACKAYWEGRVGVQSTGACGSGDGGSEGGGATCEQPSDCTGLLPKTCQLCADGTSQCAHWDCNQNECVVTVCGDDGGAVSP
jgi:hypothetical protein